MLYHTLPPNPPPVPSQHETRSLDFLGYPDYRVSANGKIYVWHRPTAYWKEMKLSKNSSRGTNNVVLYHKGKSKRIRISHLVLYAFRGPSPHPGRLYCHHLNGNASDCAIENLVWLPWTFSLLKRKKRADRLRPKQLRARKEKHEKRKAHRKEIRELLKPFLAL